MNFITIRDGLKVRKEDIICIEKTDSSKCKVHTAIGEYESVYPYETLSMLLEIGNLEEKIQNNVPQTDNPNSRNLFGAQHWAG